MKPIPVDFHIGPLLVHTYGIGLAITFWFAYRYFERRLRAHGYPSQWLTSVFIWIIVAAILGARAMHDIANLTYYIHRPGDILAIWEGGLSSFGGLIAAVPTGIILVRRRCPELATISALDLVAPVLMAAWALGRLLGPQLMIAGGGHPTNQWFGMYYADQVGKRLPVPIFQSVESWIWFLILLQIERRWAKEIPGIVITVGAGLWGLGRFFDEHLWLAPAGFHVGSFLVQLASVGLVLASAVITTRLVLRYRRQKLSGTDGHTGQAADGSTAQVADVTAGVVSAGDPSIELAGPEAGDQ